MLPLAPAAALSATLFLYGAGVTLLGTYMSDLRARHGLTGHDLGLLAALLAGGLAVSSLLGGGVSDRFGRRTSLAGGVGLQGVALSLLAVDSVGWTRPLGFALLGFGGGLAVNGANSLAGDLGGERRAAALNLTNLFYGLGTMATPLGAAAIDDWASLPAPALVLATLLGALMLWYWAAPLPPGGAAPPRPGDFAALFSDRRLRALGLLFVLYAACEVTWYNWLVRYLESAGFTAKAARYMLTFGFASGLTLGRLRAASVRSTRGESRTLERAAAATAVATAVMLLLSSPWSLILCCFAAGFAMAPIFPTGLGVAAAFFPRTAGTAMGIVVTAAWVGQAAISLAIGAVAEAHSLRLALASVPVAACGLFALCRTGVFKTSRGRA